MRSVMVVATVLLVLGAAAPAGAGSLRIGNPTVSGDIITVPVLLDGDVGDGAAAASFRLNYNPSVVEIVDISAGLAATSAGKDVRGNVREPGGYQVVLMGMNMQTMAGGEVAMVQLRKLADTESGRTNVSITDTSLASAQGTEIPSRGSTGTIDFAEAGTEEPGTEPEQPEVPEQPDGGAVQPSPDTPQPPAQNDTPGTVTPVPDPLVPTRSVPGESTTRQPGGDTSSAATPSPGAVAGADASSTGQPGTPGASQLSAALDDAGDRRAALPVQGGTPESGQDAAIEPGEAAAESPVTDTQAPTAAVADGVGAAIESGAVTRETMAAVRGTERELPADTVRDSAQTVAGRPDAASGLTGKLVFAGVLAAVVLAIVILRRRLFT